MTEWSTVLISYSTSPGSYGSLVLLIDEKSVDSFTSSRIYINNIADRVLTGTLKIFIPTFSLTKSNYTIVLSPSISLWTSHFRLEHAS